MDIFEQTIYRKLVEFEAGRRIFCPHCSRVLDARTTIVATSNHGTSVTCAQCWGKAPMMVTEGPVQVYDGRALWPKKQRRG